MLISSVCLFCISIISFTKDDYDSDNPDISHELLFKYFINFTALLLSPFPGEDSRL